MGRIYLCDRRHDKEDGSGERIIATGYLTESPSWSPNGRTLIFNNAKCTALTPDYVNSATGLELHQFKWLENEDLIGKVDEEWNWLVGEYEKNPNAKLVHYTEGGPYFKNYKNCDYAEEWFDTYKETTRTDM